MVGCDAAAVTHGAGMSVYLAFMAIRLVELERVMKPTGSIYLQCDPKVSPYLRIIMDTIFGSENFKNEVVYRRQRDREGRRRWVSEHDGLLFYTGPRRHSWNRMLLPTRMTTTSATSATRMRQGGFGRLR